MNEDLKPNSDSLDRGSEIKSEQAETRNFMEDGDPFI
jgi:hypothetical protein